MAYDFATNAFHDLDERMRGFPEGVPDDREVLRSLIISYLAAIRALFELMRLILAARIDRSESGGRFGGFLEIYPEQVEALIAELEAILMQAIDRGEVLTVQDFVEGVRRGAISREMVALQSAIDNSSGEGDDAESDVEATGTVVNSVKEQIERRMKFKWMKDMLHAVNEIISVLKFAA